MTLLSVRDLRVKVGGFEAVSGIDFDIDDGGRVGLVGESGAGKSLTAMAIAGLTDGAYAILTGRAGAFFSRGRIRLVSRLGGGFLIGGGIWLALARAR